MDEWLTRVWEDVGGRVGGPMSARLLIQPTVAAILAVRDGVKDAEAGRTAWLWAVVADPRHRSEFLRSGWKSVSKVFFVAVVLDSVYQIVVHRLESFYPGETLIIACFVALVPYALLRGPANRVARLVRRRR